jgi:hypothetical protein
MIAATTPARGWVMAISADIATSAMASTPTRPIQKSRMIEMVSATMTGMVAARVGWHCAPANHGP